MRIARTPQRRSPATVPPVLVLLAAAALAAACGPPGEATTGGSAGVEVGARVLLGDSLHLVRGRAVGLVTNHTGVVRTGSPGEDGEVRSTIDLLAEHPEVELVALFAPEHSLRGDLEPGEAVPGGRDPETGVPVHSLYGDVRKPTPEMLDGVEVLAFDVQDVGARYYTYVSTMALAMEAAGEADLPFVVLDRPNPIDGTTVQGNVLDPGFASFVGMFPVPMRHGMTPGELALMIEGEFGVDVRLTVVPARGWRREMRFGDTGLPWVAPSPNIPSVESAVHYPGTCLFEGTPLSVGRGTERPFQQVGAPWLDGPELAARLGRHGLPGVRFEPVQFTPTAPGDGKFDGVEVSGVRFVETGPGYDPTRAAVAALVEARRLGGERWDWHAEHFDRLAGTDRLRRGIDRGLEPDRLTATWREQTRVFRERSAPYRIYPTSTGEEAP